MCIYGFALYILFLQFAREKQILCTEKNCAITVAGHRYFYRKRRVFVTFVLGGVRFSWRMQSRQGYRLIRIRPTMEEHQRELLNVSRIRRVDIDFQESRAKKQREEWNVAARKIIRIKIYRYQERC